MGFKEGRVTAALHSNRLTQSAAIQWTGRKTWLFIKPEDMWSVFQSADACGSAYAQAVHPTPFTIYKYTSQPGDVLFFPASWAHIVYSHPGPQLMVNLRKFTPHSFKSQPIEWLA